MYDLDGNAIAAPLFDVFGVEMTTAVGTCRGCSWAGPLAEVAVYLVTPGVVARCPRCAALLLVIVDRHGMACVDLDGFASLQMPNGPDVRPRLFSWHGPTSPNPRRPS
ncbi:MAG: DUF6510 family protein [Friedmanniella sp.]